MGGHIAWKAAPEEIGGKNTTILDINGSDGDHRTFLAWSQEESSLRAVGVDKRSLSIGESMNGEDSQSTTITAYSIAFQYYSPERKIVFDVGMEEGHTPYFRRSINREHEYMYWPASESDFRDYLTVES